MVFLSTTPVDIVLTLLQSPYLRNLKKFAISNFEGPPIDQDHANAIDRYWSLVFDAFTSILRSVEKVRVHTPLHVDCCTYFARMRSLKELKWSAYSEIPVFGGTSDNDPKEAVEKALGSAFAGFMQKPRYWIVLH